MRIRAQAAPLEAAKRDTIEIDGGRATGWRC
jgi:hypothetical protein